jgi:hypothetical protein
MRRKVTRDVMTVQFDVQEMHGECKLVRVKHAVLVNVRQLPDLSQDIVGEL